MFFFIKEFPYFPNTNDAIFAESTPNAEGHCEPTISIWEVVEHILETIWAGLSPEKIWFGIIH